MLAIRITRSPINNFRFIAQRVKSTAAACPITGKAAGSPSPSNSEPKSFDEMPGPYRYPFVGTIPDLMKKHDGVRWKACLHHYREYGSIVREELHCKEAMIYDPRMFLEVFRNDGPFPDGGAAEAWPFYKYLSRINRLTGMISSGPSWKHARMGMQPDILSPQAAQSYLPFINPAVSTASAAFSQYADDIHGFATRASFDMFTAAMVGKSTATLGPNPQEKDAVFIDRVVKLFHVFAELLFSPMQTRLKDYMDTQKYKEFAELMDYLSVSSDEMVHAAIANVEKRDQKSTVATELDTNSVEKLYSGEGGEEIHSEDSYVTRAYNRGLLSKEQLTNELTFLFFAGVDTTSNYISWLIYHLAIHPDKQQKLYEELNAVLKGGDYSGELSKQLPYLRACYRETHRIQPLIPVNTSRRLDKDIVLGGYKIPAGVRLSFNLMAVQHDPRYVEQPDVYLPERWLDDAVKKRKGTEAELLDHRLLATPFSFGPRMCLGSRLAETEILALVARLFQDYEITLAEDSPEVKAVQKLFVTIDPSPKLKIKSRN